VEALRPGDPQLVGSYRLLNRLGSGGMGRVFLGRSPGGRLVAVKVIRSELAADPDFRARFAQEVTSARRVSGLYTAPLVDADPDAAEPWLVTSYVDGPSLAGAIAANGPMPATGVVALALALAEGLAGIHAVGVVHRDLKPSNVLLAADGPRIIDFGISRAVDASVMTQAGMVVGSPGFMSPEQANGNAVGPASDVFSLGTVLAYAGTGVGPFGTGMPEVLLYRVVHGSPALDNVPAPLRPVIERCMSKDPEQRPTSLDLLALLTGLAPGLPAWPEGWARMNGIARAAPPAGSQAGHPASVAARPSEQTRLPEAMPPTSVRAASAHKSAFPARAPRRRRRRNPIWIAAAAVILVGCASAGIALASHDSRPPRKPESTTSAHRAGTQAKAASSPRGTVIAFIAAINKRDWHKMWQLGGKNLRESYSKLVAGFQHTRHDKITSIVSHGDMVTVFISARETTGVVQFFKFSYTVRAGIITQGQQTWLGTQNAAANQSG
jgi:serine/threonine protein kinase